MPGCSECSAGSAEQAATNSVFRRVLWIALLANFVMFLVELAASYIGDSISLQADALDFFGDSANYPISLFVLGMSIVIDRPLNNEARARWTMDMPSTKRLMA